MSLRLILWIASFALVLILVLARFLSIVGDAPWRLGLVDGQLNQCPDRFNCVSSVDKRDRFYIDPLSPTDASTTDSREPSLDEFWDRVLSVVEAMPRANVVTRADTYVHVEFTMPIIPFIDDFELHLRRDEGNVAVRSASRSGKGDLGVNRRRVEQLRRNL